MRADVANLDDGDLVTGLGQCQFEAMAQLYERHSNHVRVLATHIWGVVLADRVVQDVFGQLWQTPESYDAARGSVGVHLSMQVRLWEPPAHEPALDERSRGGGASDACPDRASVNCNRHIACQAPFGSRDTGSRSTWDRRR